MLTVWQCIGLLIGLLHWAILGLLLTAAACLLRPLLSKETGRKCGKLTLHYLFRWFLRLFHWLGLMKADTRCLDSLRDTGPLILAPNHAALWDAVFLIARLPDISCVMKSSILHNPVLGGGARLAGHIPGQPITHMIRSSIEVLSSGGKLLFFPEGTRTDPSAAWINPLRGGCALIATRSGTPVQTIFIRTSSRFLEKDWPVFRLPVFPIHIRFECGPVLTPGKTETPQAFTKRLEETFITHLSRPDPLRRESPGSDLR